MDYRRLGRTELMVSRFGLGAMVLGEWGNRDRAACLKIIRSALDAGVNLVDTADMYADGEYDLAGFCVGAVERAELIDGSTIRDGDPIIGIASSGPHSNGFSLIRKVLERTENPQIDGLSAAELLLKPTKIYVKSVLGVMQSSPIKGIAHITGGGITENIPRILPAGLSAEIDEKSWQPGPVFDWLAAIGGIETDEMRRTFNCGVGMVLVVAASDEDDVLSGLAESGEHAWHIGRICSGDGEVRYV